MQLRMSRSQLIPNLLSLINDGVITRKDLEGFSEELLNTINIYRM